MVNKAGIGTGHTVLEPSAGNGAILEAIVKMAPYRGGTVAVELDASRIPKLRSKFKSVELINSDFLTLVDKPGFDRIVMNPPFRNGQDVAHVRHAYRFCLKPGGRIVAITAPGWRWGD